MSRLSQAYGIADKMKRAYTACVRLDDENKTTLSKLKAEIKAFKPEANGNTPVLLSDRYGNPYIALLKESKAPSKVKVTKLA